MIDIPVDDDGLRVAGFLLCIHRRVILDWVSDCSLVGTNALVFCTS
jgi:hypothetical protein